MCKFVRKLTICDSQFLYPPPFVDFCCIEGIPACLCFLCNYFKVCIYRCKRFSSCTKSRELRVVFVADCFSGKHIAGKQPLAPQGDNTLRIKI